MKQQHSLARVAPLFLILFIDGMGLSLLFPILNNMIIDTSSHFLPLTTALSVREFVYGLVVGIYMLCWFFGAAILGDVSDVAGRKKALMACLIGACIGYFFSGIAAAHASLWLLIIGRVIAGLTAGSQPIAQAAIVDVSSQEHKARNIGFILLAISLGFVLGPLIGGVLADSAIVSWFNYSTPLYFAALISLINAFLLQRLFKETFEPKDKLEVRLTRAVTVFISAFQHEKIRYLSLVLLVFIFGWSNFYAFIPLYVHQLYGYSELTMSLFMAVLGIGFSISCLYLVDYFTARFDNYLNIIFSALIAASAIVAMLYLHTHVAWVWGLTVVVGGAVCLAYSTIITLFSDLVSSDEQGWVMGVTGAIMALCFGVTSVMIGWIVKTSINLPMLLAVAGLALSAMLLYFVKLAHK
jgi:DHA1 family tetracycline resistance protein-like MFS transporter